MKLLNKHFVQAWNLQHISAKEDIMEVNGDLHDWSQVSMTNPFGLNVQGVGSWDAAQLGSPLMQQDFSVGADWIPRSVTVDGKAYLAHEVNYYYYGYLNGLAWKESHGLGKDVSAVKSNITLYRPAGYVFFNGSSGNLVGQFGHQVELAAVEEDSYPVVLKLAEAPCS